jgi:hypothetical protein
MSRKSPTLFHEEQGFSQARIRLLVAILPTAFLLLLLCQVWLGHPVGRHPLSNGNVIGWTVFLWLVYLRLMTVRLVTDLKPDHLSIALGGVWSIRKIPLAGINNAEVVTYDPANYGGYGIRLSPLGRAYIANGNRGVRLSRSKGPKILIGSQRPEELERAIAAARTRVQV